MEICKWCGSNNLIFTETPNLTHFGRIDCSVCHKWNRWVTSPEKDGLRNKTSRFNLPQVLKFYDKEEMCFFCLRRREQLGEGETITIDHIEELSNGGKDELNNLQILCSSCHKLKNWVNLYMNKHLKKFYEK